MNKAPDSIIGEMSIMDASGHKELKWDMNKQEEIAEAEAVFERLVRKGYSAFGSRDEAEAKQALKTFDPTMKEMVMVPRMVGG